ncbi:hypothetical protein KIL84_015804 [Mauremys mutica]|uniref:Uncharacterized protein n=1 Tax=Mauremys mutica TaxID=74926 RepID=A0A9D4AMB9_9SAUR|nr:hypothetical protein KIL84_015804 [Mauremys mutica]
MQESQYHAAFCSCPSPSIIACILKLHLFYAVPSVLLIVVKIHNECRRCSGFDRWMWQLPLSWSLRGSYSLQYCGKDVSFFTSSRSGFKFEGAGFEFFLPLLSKP